MDMTGHFWRQLYKKQHFQKCFIFVFGFSQTFSKIVWRKKKSRAPAPPVTRDPPTDPPVKETPWLEHSLA